MLPTNTLAVEANMNIGFIGSGNIGNPVARHLIEGGHQLTIHDLVRQSAANLEVLGATWASTPREAAQGNEIVFTSLPGPNEIETVALGTNSIIEGGSKGTIYIDLSTNSPSSARRIHQAFLHKGIQVLDAPVSGGVAGAVNATLSIMIGGDKEVYEAIRPILECIGDKLFYCGPPGNGMACKICNNLITLGLSVFLPEVLTLGIKSGVDLQVLSEAISAGSGRTWVLDNKFPNTLFQGNFQPGFSLALAAKDVGLATELGLELGLPMDVTNLIEQRYIEALGRDLGHLDSDVVATLYEERTGVHLRSESN